MPDAVDLHVVRVRRRAIVAEQVDRLGHDSTGCAGSLMSVTMIGRPPVQFSGGCFCPFGRCGTAPDEELAVVDARGRCGRSDSCSNVMIPRFAGSSALTM